MRGNFHQFIERLAAEKLIDAVGKFIGGRAIDDGLRRSGENELFVRIGQRVMGDQRSDVAKFGGVRFQEFAPRGNGVKKIRDAERGARGQPGGLHIDELAVGEFDARAFGFSGVARFQQ